jgi:XTP/dITP diphosphohydrolase
MASGNRGKLREIARLLADLDVTVVPQSELGVDDAEETGDTFEANALLKAQHAAAVTGLPAIADDSGLAVDALNGRPGVFSARYSGPGATDDANIDKLLKELDGVPDAERGAAFHCVACFVEPGSDDALLARGSWRGRIAQQRQGDGGFGYDPVFIDTELGVAAAELSSEDKNRRSHRGKALAELVSLLQSR